MKILIIGPVPKKYGGKEYGGVATHIEGLSEELIRNKFNITLWYHKSINRVNNLPLKVINNTYFDYIKCIFNIKVLYSKKYKFLSFPEKLKLIYQITRLKAILNKTKFDVIHLHSLKNTISLALQEINCKTPYVITDHGFWNQKNACVEGSATYKRVKESIKGCKKLIYISDFAKSKHDTVNFNHQNKLVKIKNPIKVLTNLTPKKKESSKTTLFFNGLTQSVAIKNLPVLIDAITNDNELIKNIKLIAIVNDKGKTYLKERGVNFDIEVHGRIQWEKVVKLYEKSDLLVVPSKSDSFGLVYIEALMFGIPIIGLDKLVKEFQSDLGTYIGEGIDSNIQTSKDLAEKIKKVIESDAFKPELVYNRLQEKYSWEANINKYIEVYERAIEA